MTTAWERNTDSDEVYKTWLLKDMTPEEYNELGPVNRRTLRTQFEEQQQRFEQQQQQFEQQQQQFEQQQRLEQQRIEQQRIEKNWYKVSGAISQPTSHAGARYQLFKLASPGGLYPPGLDTETAFKTESSQEVDRSIITFSVVFKALDRTTSFIDGIKMYVLKSCGSLMFLDDKRNTVYKPATTEIPPFPTTLDHVIYQTDYKPQGGEAELGSRHVDMVVETRSIDISSDMTLDISFDMTLLSKQDPTFRFRRIENSASFVLAAPDSAHIFPSVKCSGEYEWLRKPDFNRLALSRDVHVNFDGTARGKAKSGKTAPTFTIRPLRGASGFPICAFDGHPFYKIPLELIVNDNEIADALLAKLGNDASLHKHQNTRWTIDGADVAVFYPQNQQVTLVTEDSDNVDPVLVTSIPGVKNLNQCWSNSQGDLYTLEAAEVLEKCLLWNYQNTLESWRSL